MQSFDLIMDIPEMCHAHVIRYLHFISTPPLGKCYEISVCPQIIVTCPSKKYLFDFSLVLYKSTGIDKGVLGMVLLVPFWEIINGQIGHQNKGVEMKISGILHDFRIFFIGKWSFYHTLRNARKISDAVLTFYLSESNLER